ncbi:RNA-binding (RRM/RBD/RNP motifs) family protein [Raphanus sativus]|nr:RNA-binding (RRM/RBD/RNP motifs) family protein [Raphanus sativus]
MADKANLLGKRKAEYGLKTEPLLRRHKEKETRQGLDDSTLKGTAGELSETKADESNLISEKEEETVEERLDEIPEEFSKILFVANLSRQTETSDIIDFFKDVGQVVRVRLPQLARGKHVGYGFVEFASSNEAKMALEKKNRESLHNNKIILDEAPDFVEEAAVPVKTLFIASLSRHSTKISDIIDFFKDVGQVVRVRLDINERDKFLCCGYVEFASANQANKALQNKNGEYLHDRKIILADRSGASFLPPKFEEEDFLQEESLPLDSIQDVAAMEERPDETPHSANKDVLLIANLSPQTTKTEHIIRFFEDVGSVVSVRLIVDHECKHVGYGFVEFASSYQAEKALKELNGEYLHDHKILLMRGLDDETPHSLEEAATVRNKTLFVSGLSRRTKISEIINFFKDVGEVVHVRLIVDRWGNLQGKGFVEFASANLAMKALRKKNGEYLNDRDVFLTIFQTPPYHRRPKYQDYLQRESLEINEDVAAVEKGLDETPNFTEGIVRKKTVFVDKLPDDTSILDIINFFKDVREEIIRVRLIVDGRGEHVGCCFVEMATAHAAKKAVRKNYNTSKSCVYATEIAAPYPFQPKYKLADLAEKLWYEDNLHQKSLCSQKPKPNLNENKPKKTTFPDDE